MNNHIILSCHEDDYATMAALLAGMEAHSDFVTADINELWRGNISPFADLVAQFGPKPKRDAWHGFTYPDFPWKTLLSLLESSEWRRLDLLCFIYMTEDENRYFSLPSLSLAIAKHALP